MLPPLTPLLRFQLAGAVYGTGFVGTYALLWRANPDNRATLNVLGSMYWPALAPLVAVDALMKLDKVLKKW